MFSGEIKKKGWSFFFWTWLIEMNKTTVAVLFGGQSSEHEVSCVSATTVINNINREYYNVIMIGITQNGKWIKTEDVQDIIDGSWREGKVNMVLSPDMEHKGFLEIENNQVKIIKIDVVFPVLHGLYGEDGTIQGIFELAGIPYVGCGLAASALSMDKVFTKIIVNSLEGIRQAKYVSFRRSELKEMKKCIEKVEGSLPYPVFIKPSSAGSSKGVSKAHNAEELETGLLEAAKHDEKILIEETITGREIECAVYGAEEPKASGVGEILAANSAEFYDFDAKYNNAESKTDVNPILPEGKEEEIRTTAVEIFKAVDGFGLSRVDFFLEEKTNEVVFNEINTMPGFTAISMYPMLWAKKGLDKKTLIDKLIQSAFLRHQ